MNVKALKHNKYQQIAYEPCGIPFKSLCEVQDGSYLASFRYTAGAVAARNCLHRAPLEAGAESPRFHIEYKQFMQNLGPMR